MRPTEVGGEALSAFQNRQDSRSNEHFPRGRKLFYTER
jgi:hypothetical protein